MRPFLILLLLGWDNLHWVPGVCTQRGDQIECRPGHVAEVQIGYDEEITTMKPREYFEQPMDGFSITCGYGGPIESRRTAKRNEIRLICAQTMTCTNPKAIASLEHRDGGTFAVCDARTDGGR